MHYPTVGVVSAGKFHPPIRWLKYIPTRERRQRNIYLEHSRTGSTSQCDNDDKFSLQDQEGAPQKGGGAINRRPLQVPSSCFSYF